MNKPRIILTGAIGKTARQRPGRHLDVGHPGS
jgi:hypothetical protein